MAAKNDESRSSQQTSTSNPTTNVTETIADSFNKTLNLVTNTSTTEAPPGLPTWMLLALAGGGALVMVFVVALVKR